VIRSDDEGQRREGRTESEVEKEGKNVKVKMKANEDEGGRARLGRLLGT